MTDYIDIAIYVSGGNVQGASSNLGDPNKRVRLFIVDYDNGCDTEEGDATPRVDGDPCSIGLELICSAPEGLAEIVREYEKSGTHAIGDDR